MDKKTVILACVLSLATLKITNAEDLNLVASPGWTESAEGQTAGYMLNFPGKGWYNITFSESVAPNTFYRLSWKLGSSEEEKEANFELSLDIGGKAGGFFYVINSEPSDCVAYFYSGDATSVSGKFVVHRGGAKSISLSEVKLTAVSPQELGENLIPEGSFEHSRGIPANWRSMVGDDSSPCVIGDSQNFLSGERSMEVSLAEGQRNFRSVQMPVEPGKDVELKFWAKAEHETLLSVALQAWSPFGHRGEHYYKLEKIRIGTDWQEYVINVNVSDDISRFPDLEEKMMFVCIEGEASQDVKVWFDDFSFKNISQ